MCYLLLRRERMREAYAFGQGRAACYIANHRLQDTVVRLWIDPQENLYKI